MQILPRWLGQAALATALLLGASGPAGADTTQAQADAVDAQLRGWIGRQVGSLFDPAAIPMTVTPQGDLLVLAFTFGGELAQGAVTMSPGSYAIDLKPLEGERFAVEAMRITTPLALRVSPALRPRPPTTSATFGLPLAVKGRA